MLVTFPYLLFPGCALNISDINTFYYKYNLIRMAIFAILVHTWFSMWNILVGLYIVSKVSDHIMIIKVISVSILL